MSDEPTTRYAKTADGAHIAYQVWGEGPFDLVWVPGFISHLEYQWEVPGWAELARRLGSFARVITFDKRGTGLSDRSQGVSDLDQRMLDLLAVLDAAGSEQVAVFGTSEGGSLAALFSATHPERAISLALYGSYAKPNTGPDHPIGRTPEQATQYLDQIFSGWGEGSGLDSFAPSVADMPQAQRIWAKMQRLAASPAAARELLDTYHQIDVRPVLPLVQIPTLVLHRVDDRVVSVRLGRELGAEIPGAHYVELDGADHLPTIDFDQIADHLEEFFTGEVALRESERRLATVLFTDIVGSTEHLSQAGDARWSDMLDAHDRSTAREVEKFGGRVVKGTGDGLLALFDGPTRAIKAAQAATSGAQALGLEVRAGLHTGEIIERADGDLAGIAVHIAARVADEANADEVLVSRTTADLVAGSTLRFEDRGDYTLKGIEGTQRLLAVSP